MNDFVYFILTTVIPVILSLLLGAWLYYKSKTSQKHQKAMKAVGLILISTGILIMLVGLVYFGLVANTNNERFIAEITIAVYNDGSLDFDKLNLILDGNEGNRSVHTTFYTIFSNYEQQYYFEATYRNNSQDTPYNFIEDSNNATINIIKQGNELTVTIINTETTKLYSNNSYTLVDSPSGNTIRIPMHGIDGQMQITIWYSIF